MAYDEGLAQRIRDAVGDRAEIAEKKMFGGLCVLWRGSMVAGITGEILMARVGPDFNDEALRRPHARPMDFTGKPMKGFVYVEPEGVESDADLQRWVGHGVSHARSLPGK